jgi:drug/metabolite transporter (DMT)-like permease
MSSVALASPPSRRLAGGIARCAVAACAWGCWSLVLRPTDLPARVTAPIIMGVMALALLPIARRETAARIDRPTLALLALWSVLDAGNILAFFGAMEVTTLAVAVLTHYLAPVLVALAAPAVDGDRVSGAIPASLAAVAGLVLVLRPWDGEAFGADVLLGASLGTASALCYAACVFLTRRLAARLGSARSVSWHAFGATLVLLPVSIGAGWGRVDPGDVLRLGAGGLVLGALAGWVYVRGLAVVGSTRAAVLAFFEPLVAVALGWVAWGERLAPSAAAGAALVVGAGVWVSVARTRGAVPGPPAGPVVANAGVSGA